MFKEVDLKRGYEGELYEFYYDREKTWAKIIVLNLDTINKIIFKGLKLLGGITVPELIEKEIHVNLFQVF